MLLWQEEGVEGLHGGIQHMAAWSWGRKKAHFLVEVAVDVADVL